MSDNGSPVVVLNATVRPEHRAMIRQNAKDKGLVSLSASLRDLLDRLIELEARESGVKVES